jgi:hypothetical protein
MVGASVNGILGHSALIIGLVTSLFGAIALGYATVVGDRRLLRTAPNYAWLAGVAALIAAAVMMNAILTYDFDLQYVQDVGSRSTPLLFNVAAMWSALEGSILLWLATLAGYTAFIMWRYRKRLDDPLIAWALVVMFVVTAFFFFIAFGPTDVFATGAPGVNDGPGPNPLLQNHILVMFHPPILYLGYVGFTVPFAFAIAALVTGRVGEGWLVETRRWALFAWGFLSARHHPRRLVELRGARLGRRVGVGPGRERELPAVAHRHRLHPLGDGAGAPRHAARVEHQPAGGHLLAHDPRHVPHPQRRGQQRARVRRRLHRTLAARVLRRDRRRLVVADRLARRPPAFARRDRLADLARGRVPRQQRDLHGVRLRGAARHRVPADHRGVAGPPDRGRPAVLRPACRMPIGLVLLFLMAVAPVLPWRKASTELLRDRLFCPRRGAGSIALAFAVASVPTGGRRCSRSASAGSPPARRCASWCSPPVARDGAASSGVPTAA